MYKYLLITLLLLLPVQAVAQNIQTIPPGDDTIVSLEKGKPAPFDGQLFSIDTALRWGFWLQQYKLRLREDVELAQKKCEVELTYKTKELEIATKYNDTVEKDLTDRLLKSEKRTIEWQDEALNPPFFKSLTFGVILGTVVTGTIAGLVIWALH